MAMSVGPADEGEDIPMSDINTTPLVDVMLVLLIIFLIAIPVVLQTVPVQAAGGPLRGDARPSRRTSTCRSAAGPAAPARSIGT